MSGFNFFDNWFEIFGFFDWLYIVIVKVKGRLSMFFVNNDGCFYYSFLYF